MKAVRVDRGLRAVLVLVLALGTASLARAGQVELVSRVAPDQTSGTAMGSRLRADGTRPSPTSLSTDGRYVAFVTQATNLIPGQDDRNGIVDVFLRDRVAGTTVLVSQSAASPTVPSNGGGSEAALSADGRYVAWAGFGTDVAAGQAVGKFQHQNLFLFDRVSGTNRVLVLSAAQLNSQFGQGAQPVAFSPEGRFLLFLSDAPDVLPGLSGFDGNSNAYLYDLNTSAIILASRGLASPATAAGATFASLSGDGRSVAFSSSLGHVLVFDRVSGAVEDLGNGFRPVLNDDGRCVAFLSSDTNRVPGQIDGNGADPRQSGADAFVHDRLTHSTVLVSRALGSAVQAGNQSLPLQHLSISPDGRYVAFVSRATDVLPGQPAFDSPNLLLFDRTPGTVKLVAQDHYDSVFPLPANYFAGDIPVFSADGRFLAFTLTASPTGFKNVFIHDLGSGRTDLLSTASAGIQQPGDRESFGPLLSDDGRIVVFASGSTNLVPGLRDFNEGVDVFARDTASGALETLTLRAAASLTPARQSLASSISADGRWTAFVSEASHLVSGQVDLNQFADSNHPGFDVFLYDAQTRSTLLVSRAGNSPTTTGDAESGIPVVSADGRFVAFTSQATNITPASPPPDSGLSLYLFDRTAGTTVLVSRSGSFYPPALSADGRYLVFTSERNDLIQGQVGASGSDVFLYDRTARSFTLVSHSTAGPLTEGNERSIHPVLSADGRYVLFLSRATNLVPGQVEASDDSYDVFLYDRVTSVTSLVSHARGASQEAAGALDERPALSADGRYAAFFTRRTDLGNVSGSKDYNLYLHDRSTGTNTLVASVSVHFSGDGDPLLSSDGRVLAFTSADTLVPGQPSSSSLIFLYDRIDKSITLASRAGHVPDSNGLVSRATSPALSADGRYTAFLGNFVVDSTSTRRADVYLFDRATGKAVLASPSRTSPTTGASGAGGPVLISADGRTVAFSSISPDLVEGDLNRKEWDVFLFRPDSGGPATLPPCTLLDTRKPGQGPALRSNVRKTVKARGACGVPADAKAVLVKLTALQGTGKGNLRLFPGNAVTPAGTLRFEKQQTRAASFTVPLAADGTFAILPFVAGNGTVQVTVEVSGYSR